MSFFNAKAPSRKDARKGLFAQRERFFLAGKPEKQEKLDFTNFSVTL